MSTEHAVTTFIAEQLRTHATPLVVGLQGPQGCGKSHTAARVDQILSERGLRVAVLSLDDLYLPHAEMEAVGRAHPDNALLHGRGQPGTHDTQLGTVLLRALRTPGEHVDLPVYDKSAHGGLGDRAPRCTRVDTPVDVVIFEGWCLGFVAVPDDALEARIAATATEQPVHVMRTINDTLREWERAWYPLIDVYVQLFPGAASGPQRWEVVYAWRLEAEHKMKARNGGRGMSDDAVRAFVRRYIPTYRLYGEHAGVWPGHTLRACIGVDRQLLDVEYL